MMCFIFEKKERRLIGDNFEEIVKGCGKDLDFIRSCDGNSFGSS